MKFGNLLGRLRHGRPSHARPRGHHVEALEDRQYFATISYTAPPPTPLGFLTPAAGHLYFQDYASSERQSWNDSASTDPNLRYGGLWRTDGAPDGVEYVADARIPTPYGGPKPLVVGEQKILLPDFSKFAVIDGATGAVSSLKVSNDYGVIGPAASLGAFALFIYRKEAYNGVPAETLLFRTDGTEAGTVPVHSFGQLEVREMAAAADSSAAHLIVKTPAHAPSDTLFAIVNIPAPSPSDTLYATWRSDGTAAGTARVLDLAHQPAYGLVAAGGADVSFFVRGAQTISSNGFIGNPTDRWLSDGTPVGSRVADHFDIGHWWTEESAVYTQDQLAYGRNVFSTRTSSATGNELVLDSNMVDLVPGGLGSEPKRFFVASDGTLYFSADDPSHGRELWASDGTAAGTRMVADVIPGEGGSNPFNFVEFNGSIYFVVDTDVFDWRNYLYRLTGDGVVERVTYTDGRLAVEAEPNQAMRPATFDIVSKHDLGHGATTTTDRSFIDPNEVAQHSDAIRVTGPDGAARPVRLVSVMADRTHWPGHARFAFADGRPVGPADTGTYTVELLGGRVRNADGEFVAGQVIGTFELKAPDRGPDLVASVTHVGKPLTSVVAGQKIPLKVRVENRGNGPLKDSVFVKLLAVPGDAPQEIGWSAGGVPLRVKSLTAGRSKTVKAFAVVPSFGPDGTRFIRAVVDANDVHAETDESNNAGDGPAFPFARWAQPLRVHVAADLGTVAINATDNRTQVRVENVSDRPFSGELRLALIEPNEVENPLAFYASQPVRQQVSLRPGESVTIDYPFYQVENLQDAGRRTLHFQVDSLKPIGAGGTATATVVAIWP